jgi:hypothetical protein
MEISTEPSKLKRPSDPASLYFYKITGTNNYPRHEPIWTEVKRAPNRKTINPAVMEKK